LRFRAKKELLTPQNFIGGEAAVYSCKNYQRAIFPLDDYKKQEFIGMNKHCL
jgi:hypothetical protein